MLFFAGCNDSGGNTKPANTLFDNANAVQNYLFVYNPVFQVGENDHNATGIQACGNVGGTYQVSNVLYTDEFNYSITYALNNCLPVQYSYIEGVVVSYPLTGTYNVSKSGTEASNATTITPITSIEIGSTGLSILPAGSLHSTKSLQTSIHGTVTDEAEIMQISYVNWKIKNNNDEVLTGNYTTNIQELEQINNTTSITQQESVSQTFISGASISSSNGWSMQFYTGASINRVPGYAPTPIKSGSLLCTASDGSLVSIGYNYSSFTTSYTLTSLGNTISGVLFSSALAAEYEVPENGGQQ